MKTLYEKMRDNRSRWIKPLIQVAETAHEIHFMAVNGAPYVESPEIDGCEGCAFISHGCNEGWNAGRIAFGGDCTERDVIYIKAE